MNQSLFEAPPQIWQDRLTAIDNSQKLDEAALFGTASAVTDSDVSLTALSLPLNTTIGQGGTAGTTNYTYVVADVGNVGLAPAAGVQTTTGAATLNTTNFNTITWVGLTGHTYNVYRSASSGTPATTGLIKTISIAVPSGGTAGVFSSQTVNDTGLTASGNVPTANTTGSMAVPGCIFLSGLGTFGANVPTLTNAAGQTLTVAQMTNQVLKRAGAVTVTDTTPTAAQLVAAFPGVQVNQGFHWAIKNANTGTLTLAAGTGVTINGTATTATVNAHLFFVQFTNVTSGSEAVTIESLVVSAY